MPEIWAAAVGAAAAVGGLALSASQSGGGGGGGITNQTTEQKPIYPSMAMPFYKAEADLANNVLFPLEGSIQKTMQRRLNPNNGLLPWEMGTPNQSMNLASQVGQYMPGSTSSQGFLDNLFPNYMRDLQFQDQGLLADINKNLISPQFAGLLAPRGSTSTSQTTQEQK